MTLADIQVNSNLLLYELNALSPGAAWLRLVKGQEIWFSQGGFVTGPYNINTMLDFSGEVADWDVESAAHQILQDRKLQLRETTTNVE